MQRWGEGCVVKALPVDEAVEELLATAALCDEHQIARCDVGFVQRHHLVVMQGLEDVVLLQHCLLIVRLVRHDLGHEQVARGVLPALADHTEATPMCGERKHTDGTKNISFCGTLECFLGRFYFICT